MLVYGIFYGGLHRLIQWVTTLKPTQWYMGRVSEDFKNGEKEEGKTEKFPDI